MWFSNKINDSKKGQSTQPENSFPETGLVLKGQTRLGKQATSEPDEIAESFLDEVGGGVNPQPLPPRDDNYSLKALRAR